MFFKMSKIAKGAHCSLLNLNQRVVTSLLCVLTVLTHSTLTQNTAVPCNPDRGCYPPIFNIEQGIGTNPARTITVSSTCSQTNSASGQYRNLNIFDTTVYTCNSASIQPINMVDTEAGTTPTYWQSNNMIGQAGADPVPQFVIFNFTNVFSLHTVSVKFAALQLNGQSADAKPAKWRIDKYDDATGQWEPLRYVALDCAASFPGVELYDDITTPADVTSLLCLEYFPPTDPFSDLDNWVDFNPGNYDAFGNRYKRNVDVLNHFSTSAIRLYFMSPPSDIPLQSYVAISTVYVEMQCRCNGHASQCVGPNEADCVCQHNTQGPECSQCLPKFNNQSWAIGLPGDANACEECMCNDHADSCTYDPAKDHGVCTACTNNSEGDFCESCVTGFYRNVNVTAYTTDVVNVTFGDGTGGDTLQFCLPCLCYNSGTEPNALGSCDVDTGQCTCKAFVTGRDCSECQDTYWNLMGDNPLGCTACDCDVRGTTGNQNLCDKITGLCLCKANVQGGKCDACKPLSFNFDPANPEGCTLCNCDPGASLSAACNAGGQCNCVSNTLTGRDCRTPSTNYYVPRLDMMILEPESSATITSLTGAIIDPKQFLVLRLGNGQVNSTVSGRGLVLMTSANQIQMSFTSPFSGAVNFIVRFEKQAPADVILLTGSLTLTFAQSYVCGSVNFPPNYSWTLTYSGVQSAERGGVIVGQACLQNGASYNVVLTNPGPALLVDSVVLIPDISQIRNSLSQRMDRAEIDRCEQEAVTELRANREDCASTEYSIMSAVLGQAWGCGCTSGAVIGTTCDPYSGDCTCRPGALTPDCQLCEVDGYAFSPSYGCLPCGCYDTGSVSVACDDNGVCDCLPNVSGTKCDSCVPENYGLATGEGCQPCECDMTYSLNNACEDNGQCSCKPGINERDCSACQNGYYNLTSDGCTTCTCDPLGSTNRSCDVTTGECECLLRVEGTTCDTCKEGFFGLGKWNPDGCIECFCWDRGTSCSDAPGWFSSPISSNWPVPAPVLDPWTAVDANGVPQEVTTPFVTTSSGSSTVMRMLEGFTSLPVNFTDAYFVAPPKYLGDRTPTYGRHLTGVLRPRQSSIAVMPNPSPTIMTTTANATDATMGDFKDILIVGEYTDFILGMDYGPVDLGMSEKSFQVPILEDNMMKFDSLSGDPVQATFPELMQTLTKVSALWIRGFNIEDPEMVLDLKSVTLQSAIEDPDMIGVSADSVNNVAQCECDEGYAGRICEQCAAGYTRADPNNTRPDSTCVLCSCNDHGVTLVSCDPVTALCSDDVTGPCDPVTGVCMCQDNTGGDNCELCLPGFYGDATRGTEDDCLPCACPGNVPASEINVFATTCELQNGVPVCLNCSEGHAGDNCEICIEGFYGTPENASNADGACQPCVCNGRAVTCDTQTGQCINCTDNTAGMECEICGPGFYGNPAFEACRPCPCAGLVGGTGLCDPFTGACECLSNVTGASCDLCLDGYFNLTAGVGCEPCGCHENGSVSFVCNKVNGQCSCVANAVGRTCDQCVNGFWNLRPGGCQQCFCNPTGTAKDQNGNAIQNCDVVTGQCTCALPGITGRTCDRCSPVSTYTFEYVTLFQIGVYPNCELCGECFDSWALTLDGIGEELATMDHSLRTVWSNYGNQTSESVSPILDGIADKINQTNTSMANIETVANQLQALGDLMTQTSARESVVSNRIAVLSETERSLSLILNTVTALTEAVQVTGTTVTSLTSLNNQLNLLESQSLATFNQGSALWQRIQTLSFVVASPEERQRQIRQQAQRYMVLASIASDTFALVKSLYNTTLTPGTRENERELEFSKERIANGTVALAQITNIAAKVMSDATSAQTTVSSMLDAAQTARTTMLALVDSLEEHAANASEARDDAENSIERAQRFQTVAERAEDIMIDSMTSVLESIDALTQTQQNMVTAQVQSIRVQGTRLRSLGELQAILAQIAASTLSPDEVDELEREAQSMLFNAEQALGDTQQALQESKELSEETQLMKDDITSSRNLRVQAEGVRLAADSINDTVTNVLNRADDLSSTAESNIATIGQLARDLLANITQASTDFATRKNDVANAVTSSIQAETRVQTATTSQRDLLQVMGVLNTELDEANMAATLTTMTQADNEMTDLVSEFTGVTELLNIQTLIQDLTSQNAEMTNLEAEVDQLMTQVDALVLQLKETTSGTTCNNSG